MTRNLLYPRFYEIWATKLAIKIIEKAVYHNGVLVLNPERKQFINRMKKWHSILDDCIGTKNIAYDTYKDSGTVSKEKIDMSGLLNKDNRKYTVTDERLKYNINKDLVELQNRGWVISKKTPNNLSGLTFQISATKTRIL